LPSDAQWEYACRGGTSTAFWWGNDPNSRSAAVNNAVVLETNSTNLGPRQVGQKSPNPFGLYDMLGNVWELTHTGSATSIRGGSWNDTLAQARCANTVAIDRGTAHALVGARLILVP
jgi:formylglycine-generating enzyme required for sulfatase activity